MAAGTMRDHRSGVLITTGHAACGAQSSAPHESRDVLPLFLAGPPLLVRVDHTHADAHEIRHTHAPL